MRRTRGSASASSRRPSDTVVISSAHCGRGCCLERSDSDAPIRRRPSSGGSRGSKAVGDRRGWSDAAAGVGCRRRPSRRGQLQSRSSGRCRRGSDLPCVGLFIGARWAAKVLLLGLTKFHGGLFSGGLGGKQNLAVRKL